MICRVAIVLLAALGVGAHAGAHAGTPDGRELIEESLHRHTLPAHVYEEQTLLLSDADGRRHAVRSARFYARRDESGTQRLLVIESPVEARGLSLYFARDAEGGRRRGAGAASAVFGSDFSVADLEGEQPQEFDYEIAGSRDIQRVPHHLLRAVPRPNAPGVSSMAGGAAAMAAVPTYRERQIYLRKDNLFVTRIDYQDGHGRILRRQTFRDPRPDESGAWRPGMILMEDLRSRRRSLLKVERRIHSADYVPDSVFAGARSGRSHERALPPLSMGTPGRVQGEGWGGDGVLGQKNPAEGRSQPHPPPVLPLEGGGTPLPTVGVR